MLHTKANEGRQLATFNPAHNTVPGHNHGLSLAKLIVDPAGQEFFDDILISLLIIERKRHSAGINRPPPSKRLFG